MNHEDLEWVRRKLEELSGRSKSEDSDEVFNTIFARNREDAKTASKITIAVVGQGGVGSHVSLQLAAIGFGLILIDFDVYEEENKFRSAIDPEYVGLNKAEAMATTLTTQYPQEISFLPVDVTNVNVDDLRAWLEECSAVVLATGNPRADYIAGTVATELGILVVRPRMWGADEEAIGDIEIYAPRGPNCFVCWRDEEQRELHGESGHLFDVDLLASYTTKAIADLFLRRNDGEVGPRIIRGETYSVIADTGVRHAYFHPNPQCRNRHGRRDARPFVPEGAKTFLKAMTLIGTWLVMSWGAAGWWPWDQTWWPL